MESGDVRNSAVIARTPQLFTLKSLCCFCCCGEHFSQLFTVGEKGTVFVFVQKGTGIEQFQPIDCFGAFFEGDVYFGEEVFFVNPITGLRNVSPNTGTASQDLLGQHKFFVLMKLKSGTD